jgi:hypothetical protein
MPTGKAKEIEIAGSVFQTEDGSPATWSHGWLEGGTGVAYLPDVLTSTHMLDVVDALIGKVHRSAQADVHGVAATEYKTHMTLASFYAAVSGSFSRPSSWSGMALIPSATSITIPVTMWLDPMNRIVRLQATEPLYTAIYTDGSDQEEAVQADPVGSPSVGLRRLRQQSFSTTTVDIYDFGTAVHITAPPSSRIAHDVAP